MDEYKYQVEYSKSSRANCRGCHSIISKDSLRLAIMIQAHNFDARIPHWYHFKCFFVKNRVASTSAIKNFESIRYEDQKRIEDEIEKPLTGLMSVNKEKLSLRLARAKDKDCSQCGEKPIAKSDLIVHHPRPVVQVFHAKCFIESHPEINLAELPSYFSLKSEERVFLDSLLASRSRKSKKRPTEDYLKSNAKISAFERKLKQQSEGMWKIRKILDEEVTKDALIGLLEFNDQNVPKGQSLLLDALQDVMYFGALKPCPECPEGRLYYHNGHYKCDGMLNDLAHCPYTTLKPARKAFGVPNEYRDVTLLRDYKCIIRERLFKLDITNSSSDRWLSSFVFAIAKGPFELSNLEAPINISSDKENAINSAAGSEFSTDELKNLIKKFGGKLTNQLLEGVTVISTKKSFQEFEKDSILKKAIELGLLVLSYRFIEEISLHSSNKVPDFEFLKKKHTVVKRDVLKQQRHVEREAENAFQNILVKDGATVDPQSELEDIATVATDSQGHHLTAVLGLVSMYRGSNSYYKLQVLKADKGSKYWVFRSWGRIGTNIGGTKLEQFKSLSAAEEEFLALFLDKTGCQWNDYCDKKHKPQPDKFFPMELQDHDEYEESEKKRRELEMEGDELSILPKETQVLIRFIFDLRSLNRVLMQYEINIHEMPLGKISKAQIRQAYAILGELADLISGRTDELDSKSQAQVVGLSGRFFTLIPHDFGMRLPPILDNIEILRSKLRMLEDLLDIEVAYRLLNTGLSNELSSPIDSHYKQLNSELKPLAKDSADFLRIVKYVQNTHASTHKQFSINVEAVFDIEREGEAELFNKTKEKVGGNVMLLWHGSRRTNWVGILSQGLRIAPPEAPVTGYMFGKGIYFADMASKSAQYCYATREDNNGIILLCEVILGKVHECRKADASPLPRNYNSRKGVAPTGPDLDEAEITPDGVLIPCGKWKNDSTIQSDLLYNEYIVYDEAQVKQKYLVRLNFQFQH